MAVIAWWRPGWGFQWVNTRQAKADAKAHGAPPKKGCKRWFFVACLARLPISLMQLVTLAHLWDCNVHRPSGATRLIRYFVSVLADCCKLLISHKARHFTPADTNEQRKITSLRCRSNDNHCMKLDACSIPLTRWQSTDKLSDFWEHKSRCIF